MLTTKCASRHNSVHFFAISTSKSGPNMVRFVHVDFEMCFAPQQRALFRHLNFQKWSKHGVFCTCWLRNLLRATTACTFSTSQLPKVVRTWCALYILTCKCASRHNGVHFFISHLVRWLHTRRFSGASNHGKKTEKTQCFATFLPFRAPASSFFWLFLFSNLLFAALLFSSLTLTTSAFHLSILSEVWILNFLRISYIPMNTSSTAQGGGGSFKNRKPIGEVGCCYSQMAKRIHGWTERWLISLTLFLSLLLSFSLFLWLSTYLPTDLSVYLSIYLSLSLSSVYLTIYIYIYLNLNQNIYIYIYLYLYLYLLYLSIYLSIDRSIYRSINLSIYLSICLSVYLSIYLSI